MNLCLAVASGMIALLPFGFPDDCPDPIGGLPFGWVERAVGSGDHVLYSTGSGVRIADVSTPSAPVVVAQLLLPGRVWGIAASGTHAFVTITEGSGGRLVVFEVTDPSAPVQLGSCATPRYPRAVAVSGDHAYVAWGESSYLVRQPWGGVVAIDVSDPSSPVEVGSVATPVAAYGLALSGTHAFVIWYEYNFGTGLYDGGLTAVDIANPAAPAAIGSYEWPGSSVYGIDVAGDHAFVTADPLGLRVLNVANPAAPVEVGGHPVIGHGVTVSGSYAFVGALETGLRILDLTTPSSPQEVGFADTPGYVYGAALIGSSASVADGPGGLRLVDVANVTSPTEVGALGTTASMFARGVTTRGDHAFVAADEDGLRIVDISDPALPLEIGSWQSPQDANDVEVSGSHAYVACGHYLTLPHGALRVIDVSDPSSPHEVGAWTTVVGEAVEVALTGNLALVVNGALHVIDVSEPASPVEIGVSSTPGEAEAVAVSGPHAYVADGYDGLLVVDLSVPSAPVEVAWLDTPGYARDVAISHDLALVADSHTGLRLIDVSNPVQPTEVGVFQPPGNGVDRIAVQDNLALATSWLSDDRLWIVDVSEPATPIGIGGGRLPRPLDLVSAGERAVVAAEGIRIFDLGQCLALLFADGFESGTTSTWSLTQP